MKKLYDHKTRAVPMLWVLMACCFIGFSGMTGFASAVDFTLADKCPPSFALDSDTNAACAIFTNSMTPYKTVDWVV